MVDSDPPNTKWANELLKNTTVLVALIVGICVIICTSMLSAAIMAYGRSLERVAEIQRPSSIPNFPSSFRVHIEGGNPLRFDVNTKP